MWKKTDVEWFISRFAWKFTLKISLNIDIIEKSNINLKIIVIFMYNTYVFFLFIQSESKPGDMSTYVPEVL